VRCWVEIQVTDDGRIEGQVRAEGDDTAHTFSGWLELCRLLEGGIDAQRHDE
jgi:hypothetical protein